MVDFAPYEIPTRGLSPPLRLHYEETPKGRRMVLSDSPWVTLIVRADGGRASLGRTGAAWLEPGDSVVCPASETEAVDAALLSRTRMTELHAFHESRGHEERNARWWWLRRELPDGRVLHLHQASSNARLSVSLVGQMGFEGSWCYGDHGDGWRAALGWNGWGDPPDGWHRHLETARRRKDGTAATEYLLAYEGGEQFAKRGGW